VHHFLQLYHAILNYVQDYACIDVGMFMFFSIGYLILLYNAYEFKLKESITVKVILKEFLCSVYLQINTKRMLFIIFVCIVCTVAILKG